MPQSLTTNGKMATPEDDFRRGNRGSRKGVGFKKEYIRQVKKLCELGATDWDVAKFFDVQRSTIYNWRLKHPAFANAMQLGKEAANTRVKRALYERAVGYTYESEKIVAYKGDYQRVPVDVHVPPDPGAAVQFLTNRDKDWHNTQRHELTGPDGQPIEIKKGLDHFYGGGRIPEPISEDETADA